MTKYALLFVSLLIANALCGQRYIDSLRNELAFAKEDSDKVNSLVRMADYFSQTNADSTACYSNKAIILAKRIRYPRGILMARISVFFSFLTRADYPKALKIAQDNLILAEALPYNRIFDMAYIHINLAAVKYAMGDTIQNRLELQETDRLYKVSGNNDGDLWSAIHNQAMNYQRKKNKDSALFLEHQAMELVKKAPFRKTYSSLASAYLAKMYLDYGMLNAARHYYQQGLEQAKFYGAAYLEARINMNLMQFCIKSNQKDSAIYFADNALAICKKYHFGDYASTVADSLYRIFEEKGKTDSALRYMKIMMAAKDSIFSQAKMQAFQRLISENDQRQREAEVERERLQSKIKLYTSLSGIAIFLVISAILYRNNRQRKKAYAIIRNQKQETEIQKAKVEEAYQELKSAQRQLIQSEKMASLGEMTAGIAHEIQNPLNFVNNFSELNGELIEEMERALKIGNQAEAVALAGNIRQNMEKINQHGKRAQGIVTGMLQHSRTTAGEKQQPTDINALAEEYLRLSLHAMKAKDSGFECKIGQDMDPSIGKINVIPQDLGRVFLNIFNNAFYAVGDKKKKLDNGFEPEVFLRTKKKNDQIEICIRDNGSGVSQKNIEKIFQPFFTTKPTGQGTGLGLSLAYDIITKEHNGKISVQSGEGEYAEFLIVLSTSGNPYI
ncbi:two-component sensor histidine kinase [Candidatus Cerribacteria bacterium 'Amazon FNV 2010 28 9']|uniref:histidine kinase n=1 Tax=Candidatus Cerribacteria bacterium 'Amazon FNV 2010 28 9' TaxID=2081795 RepID=A0A317JN55_9BACT|nr:MAG: two-component sensor histidine kinase [Candidatus Cerribacteria bacterium 'Amazon FNV 2010 28 9']